LFETSNLAEDPHVGGAEPSGLLGQARRLFGLRDLSPRRRAAVAAGAATCAIAVACLFRAAADPSPGQSLRSIASDPGREIAARASAGMPVSASASLAPEPLAPARVETTKAIVDASNALPTPEGAAANGALSPPAADVTGVEVPLKPPAPTPRPMEVAIQTSEAPAVSAPIQAQPAAPNDFSRNAAHDQHLPIPSRW
jgi:hypothetical protein